MPATNYSESETRLMIACFKQIVEASSFKWDYAALAEDLGLSSKHAAVQQWARLKKKMEAANGDPPATPTNGKRKANDNNGDERTPVSGKKSKTTPETGRKKKVDIVEEAASGQVKQETD